MFYVEWWRACNSGKSSISYRKTYTKQVLQKSRLVLCMMKGGGMQKETTTITLQCTRWKIDDRSPILQQVIFHFLNLKGK